MTQYFWHMWIMLSELPMSMFSIIELTICILLHISAVKLFFQYIPFIIHATNYKMPLFHSLFDIEKEGTVLAT